jgi:hypothetical protein
MAATQPEMLENAGERLLRQALDDMAASSNSAVKSATGADDEGPTDAELAELTKEE